MLGPTTWAVENRGSSTVKRAASRITSMHRSRRDTSQPSSTGTHETGSRSRRPASAPYGSTSSCSSVSAAPSGNRPSIVLIAGSVPTPRRPSHGAGPVAAIVPSMTRRPIERPGMGAVPYRGGTTFRVWAPHAEAVFVTGTFDDWAGTGPRSLATATARPAPGPRTSPRPKPGAEYQFTIRTADGDLSQARPVCAPRDEFGRQRHRLRPGRLRLGRRRLRDAVLGRPGHLRDARRHLCRHGRPARHVRCGAAGGSPTSSASVFRPSRSCRRSSSRATSRGATTRRTCSPSSPGYGGPDAFKRFIRDAHAHGIAVIVDVVYNHLGPSDLDLWRFDGWAEGDGGGIYFYNDERAVTPWGATRPDYGRGEVRTFLRDSAMTWLEEFRCDGLRFDSTIHIRSVNGDPCDPAAALPDGASFLAWINDEIRVEPALEDHDRRGPPGRSRRWSRRPARAASASGRSGMWASSGGSGRLWSTDDDAERDLDAVVEGIVGEGRGAPLSRVIYTESHDEVANGRHARPRGDRARLTPAAGGRRSGRCSARRSS